MRPPRPSILSHPSLLCSTEIVCLVLVPIFTPYSCCNKVLLTRYLKQQTFIISQNSIWRLDIWNQGVFFGRVCSSWGLDSGREDSVLGSLPWLVDGHLLPVSLCIILPLWISLVYRSPPLYEDTSHAGLGLNWWLCFNLIISVKTYLQIFHLRSHSEVLGVRSPKIIREVTIQP